MTNVPDLHISSKSEVKGKATVKIDRRTDSQNNGIFSVDVYFGFTGSRGVYPKGKIEIEVDLSDAYNGIAKAMTIEQLNLIGRKEPDTVCVTGRCNFKRTGSQRGWHCHYWLLITDNKCRTTGSATPDIISFIIYDSAGHIIANGTGPVVQGGIEVYPLN